jgi:hypothetical protein
MRGLISLYPRVWRERYGDEFLLLIAERPPTLTDRLDIVRGALDAHMSPQLPGPDLLPDRSGFVPLAGVLSIVIGLLLAVNGPVHFDEYGSYRDGAAALPFMILAMAALAYGIYRLSVRLPDGAFGSRSAAALAIICGLFWSTAPWVMPALAVCLVAIAVLTANATRAGVWPAPVTFVLVALSAIPVAMIAVMLSQPWYVSRGQPELVLIAIFGPLLGIWTVLGVGLLRGFPAKPTQDAAAHA